MLMQGMMGYLRQSATGLLEPRSTVLAFSSSWGTLAIDLVAVQ
jgi:hypothetical protein